MSDAEEKPADKGPTNGSNGSGKLKSEGWPRAYQAARLLAIKPQAISAMVQRGELHPVTDGDGYRRYDPVELEQYMPDPNERRDSVSLVEGLTKTLEVTTEAMQKYLRLIPDPMQKVLEQQTTIIERQQARIQHLESEQIQMLDSMAALIRGSEERETAKLEAVRRQDRLDQCTKVLVEQGPKFLQDITLGADMRKLLHHMDPKKVDALLEIPEMLDDTERSVLGKLRDRMVAAQAEQKSQAEKTDAKKTTEPAPKTPPGKDDLGTDKESGQ
ncbi:MAG: hypothetical protein PHX83_14560 [Acidobacteriia bacterium]|nr:hypothetical protein [Terriglobia bacterium]